MFVTRAVQAPLAARGTPAHPPLLRTRKQPPISGALLGTTQAWRQLPGVGTFKNPQNPGHVCKCHRETGHCGDIPVPSPLPWCISCPGAFSGLPLGSRKVFGVT